MEREHNRPEETPRQGTAAVEGEKKTLPRPGQPPKLLHTISSRQSERELREVARQTCPLTLYVGNLPKSWNKEDISNYFNHYGTITDVVTINKNREFSGAALVTFTSLSDADEAIERLRNTTIPGANAPVNMKWSDIEEHRLGLLQHDDHTLYIKSLPRKANTESLRQVFTLLGEIDQIRMEETKYHAFVKYIKKESALLAIRLLGGQTFLHGSHIPIEIWFKEKKYHSIPETKDLPDPMNIVPQVAVYREIYNEGQHYFFNCSTHQSQYDPPPVGSLVYRMDGAYYYQQQVQGEHDMAVLQKKPGPPGANLFIYHLPNNIKHSDLQDLFKRFGAILSAWVKMENGRSKGYGFVSFDNPRSAANAIEEMHGFEIGGKRLKVELKKGEDNSSGQVAVSLKQTSFNPL